MGVNIIAVIGKNNEIGLNNKLIWRLPKDLKFFKETTIGKYVLMGRKTYESLPKKLKGRTMVVVSSKNLEESNDVICYHNLVEALTSLQNEDVFVIGGQSIYEQTISLADTMYLTEVKAKEPYADAYFPKFNKKEWNVEEIESGIDNGNYYTRNKYVRKKVKK